jgi:hypothetical protein
MSWRYWLPEIVTAIFFVITIMFGYHGLPSFIIGIFAGVLFADYKRRSNDSVNLDTVRKECETLWQSKKKK